MNTKIKDAKAKTCIRYRNLADKADIMAKIKDKQGLFGAAKFHRSVAAKNRAIADHIESTL